ncbi:MAG: hypothetical protein ACRCR9_02435 [Chitinophagaceae bacterium]
MKRVLISVSDKTGIIDFAKRLHTFQYQIISTGGTQEILEAAGISTLEINEFMGFPEILIGRVTTLHPAVDGGLLSKR